MTRAAGEWVARLRIDPTVFVAPGAVVVGDVAIGARASVWFNTVVRGDTAPIEIGEDTNLQDNTTVNVDEGQPARIGSRVTVGHRSIVHGCLIEDDCLIGMGSVVLSGARVGAGSLLGAASLVREGQEIPPGSLALGSPARVVGPVADAHRDAIRHGARHYAELAASYRARGFARPHPWPGSESGITSRAPGPMGFLEWGRLVATLAEGPDWALAQRERAGDVRFRAAPGPGRWSALEVVCHLRDSDLEVYLPRLARMLAEDAPRVENIVMGGWDEERRYRDETPAAALAAWAAVRLKLVGTLAPLGRAEWLRLAIHSVRGPFPLAEMLRDWVEHDVSHRRQIEAALAAAP